ncbi:MAG TPA: hypothetical protein VHS28_10785, partial [Chloroflexota bacterium]|nr:hypothetical protein [Chloroflexota bacterium]
MPRQWIQTLIGLLVLVPILAARLMRTPAPVVRVENAHGVTYRQLRHLVVGTVALVVGVIILAWVAIRTVEVLTLLA